MEVPEKQEMISAILSAGGPLPAVSFEFFPPKTDEAASRLQKTSDALLKLDPAFVSVTYGAGGSTRDRTHEVVRELRDRGAVVMAHLTCVGHTAIELREILAQYEALGVTNILALRGDPPRDDPNPTWDLAHCVDLIELIRQCGDFSVGVAAHPEGHPESTDLKADLEFQAAKLSEADFAVTQFFFNAYDYLIFRDEMAKRHVEIPIVPGIMPVTNPRQVARMAELSGAEFPHYLESKLSVARTPEDARAIGVNACTRICQRLLAEGVPGFQFFTLNKAAATTEMIRNLALA